MMGMMMANQTSARPLTASKSTKKAPSNRNVDWVALLGPDPNAMHSAVHTLIIAPTDDATPTPLENMNKLVLKLGIQPLPSNMIPIRPLKSSTSSEIHFNKVIPLAMSEGEQRSRAIKHNIPRLDYQVLYDNSILACGEIYLPGLLVTSEVVAVHLTGRLQATLLIERIVDSSMPRSMRNGKLTVEIGLYGVHSLTSAWSSAAISCSLTASPPTSAAPLPYKLLVNKALKPKRHTFVVSTRSCLLDMVLLQITGPSGEVLICRIPCQLMQEDCGIIEVVLLPLEALAGGVVKESEWKAVLDFKVLEQEQDTETQEQHQVTPSPSPPAPVLTLVQVAEDRPLLPETTSPFPADSTFPAPSQQPTPVTAVPMSRLAMAPLAGRLTVLVKGLVLRKMPMDGTASSTGLTNTIATGTASTGTGTALTTTSYSCEITLEGARSTTEAVPLTLGGTPTAPGGVALQGSLRWDKRIEQEVTWSLMQRTVPFLKITLFAHTLTRSRGSSTGTPSVVKLGAEEVDVLSAFTAEEVLRTALPIRASSGVLGWVVLGMHYSTSSSSAAEGVLEKVWDALGRGTKGMALLCAVPSAGTGAVQRPSEAIIAPAVEQEDTTALTFSLGELLLSKPSASSEVTLVVSLLGSTSEEVLAHATLTSEGVWAWATNEVSLRIPCGQLVGVLTLTLFPRFPDVQTSTQNPNYLDSQNLASTAQTTRLLDTQVSRYPGTGGIHPLGGATVVVPINAFLSGQPLNYTLPLHSQGTKSALLVCAVTSSAVSVATSSTPAEAHLLVKLVAGSLRGKTRLSEAFFELTFPAQDDILPAHGNNTISRTGVQKVDLDIWDLTTRVSLPFHFLGGALSIIARDGVTAEEVCRATVHIPGSGTVDRWVDLISANCAGRVHISTEVVQGRGGREGSEGLGKCVVQVMGLTHRGVTCSPEEVTVRMRMCAEETDTEAAAVDGQLVSEGGGALLQANGIPISSGTSSVVLSVRTPTARTPLSTSFPLVRALNTTEEVMLGYTPMELLLSPVTGSTPSLSPSRPLSPLFDGPGTGTIKHTFSINAFLSSPPKARLLPTQSVTNPSMLSLRVCVVPYVTATLHLVVDEVVATKTQLLNAREQARLRFTIQQQVAFSSIGSSTPEEVLLCVDTSTSSGVELHIQYTSSVVLRGMVDTSGLYLNAVKALHAKQPMTWITLTVPLSSSSSSVPALSVCLRIAVQITSISLPPFDPSTESDLALKQAFLTADRDKSGSVDLDELLHVLSSSSSAPSSLRSVPLGLTNISLPSSEAEIREMFKRLDVDGSGSISWWEWKALLSLGGLKKTIDPLKVLLFAAKDALQATNPPPVGFSEEFSATDASRAIVPVQITPSKAAQRIQQRMLAISGAVDIVPPPAPQVTSEVLLVHATSQVDLLTRHKEVYRGVVEELESQKARILDELLQQKSLNFPHLIGREDQLAQRAAAQGEITAMREKLEAEMLLKQRTKMKRLEALLRIRQFLLKVLVHIRKQIKSRNEQALKSLLTKKVFAKNFEKHSTGRMNAVKRIQKVVRGKLARLGLSRRRTAVVRIQCAVRCHRARLVVRVRRMLKKRQHAARSKWLGLMVLAAYRRYRRFKRRMRRHHASLVLSRYLRAHYLFVQAQRHVASLRAARDARLKSAQDAKDQEELDEAGRKIKEAMMNKMKKKEASKERTARLAMLDFIAVRSKLIPRAQPAFEHCASYWVTTEEAQEARAKIVGVHGTRLLDVQTLPYDEAAVRNLPFEELAYKSSVLPYDHPHIQWYHSDAEPVEVIPEPEPEPIPEPVVVPEVVYESDDDHSHIPSIDRCIEGKRYFITYDADGEELAALPGRVIAHDAQRIAVFFPNSLHEAVVEEQVIWLDYADPYISWYRDKTPLFKPADKLVMGNVSSRSNRLPSPHAAAYDSEDDLDPPTMDNVLDEAYTLTFQSSPSAQALAGRAIKTNKTMIGVRFGSKLEWIAFDHPGITWYFQGKRIKPVAMDPNLRLAQAKDSPVRGEQKGYKGQAKEAKDGRRDAKLAAGRE